MNNIITIDLEEWFHSNILDNYQLRLSHSPVERIQNNTKTLLDMFDQYQVKATFFVLGWVAEFYPELIQLIAEKGHEIASHGYAHKLVYTQTSAEFEEDLQKSIYFIEQASGIRPRGYRAPSWSIQRSNTWFFDILKKNNFDYDASIFPVKNFLYGIPDAPRSAFIEKDTGVLEFPMSTYRIATYNIPFSGGFYFRALPYPIIRALAKQLNQKGQSVIFYLHPREIDTSEPRVVHLNYRDRLIHYYGQTGCKEKLEKCLTEFTFIRMIDYFTDLDQLAVLKTQKFFES